jgi:hypothetical protein
MKLLNAEIEKSVAVNPDASIQYLFHTNSFFAQVCLRCLELCNLSPEWIDLNMLAQLLFPFERDGRLCVGILVQLNFPPTQYQDLRSPVEENATKEQAAAMKWEEMLASLWSHTKTLKDAMDVAERMPWQQLARTLEAKNELTATDNTKSDRKEAIARAYLDHVQKYGDIGTNRDDDGWLDAGDFYS